MSAQEPPEDQEDLKQTALDALHREMGAKMVPFAGYAMPVHYQGGIIAEHLHTRENACLFDVSHMGQARLKSDDGGAEAAKALETLVPGDIKNLDEGRTRYTVLTNDEGGIIDDLMVTNGGDHLFLVVNAACKEGDFAHIENRIGDRTELEILDGRALVAFQGPKASSRLSRFHAKAGTMAFMSAQAMDIGGISSFVTRSGYTGEDGFEISAPAENAEELVRLLLDQPGVLPAGLGARDTLRLEAGLCLYGSDIDAGTTPVEADLSWVVNKRRRIERGFPGAEVILGQLENGVERKRVGIRPDDKALARAHTPVEDTGGNTIGEITSGGYGPSVEGPIAMGYVKSEFADQGTAVNLRVRGKAFPAKVTGLPFVEHRYFKS